ncbi:hypothetical protein NDU88_000040 [Pleurodeles waltl]|uniref:Uncharacterized protein n=1 Tax=Pleurodeles waltl TaxID=8319 RepID=A0AAV7V5X4_PLEWA|nr:hypothetical protein NDU88_000040 [Pleurodeles waltl]
MRARCCARAGLDVWRGCRRRRPRPRSRRARPPSLSNPVRSWGDRAGAPERPVRTARLMLLGAWARARTA